MSNWILHTMFFAEKSNSFEIYPVNGCYCIQRTQEVFLQINSGAYAYLLKVFRLTRRWRPGFQLSSSRAFADDLSVQFVTDTVSGRCGTPEYPAVQSAGLSTKSKS